MCRVPFPAIAQKQRNKSWAFYFIIIAIALVLCINWKESFPRFGCIISNIICLPIVFILIVINFTHRQLPVISGTVSISSSSSRLCIPLLPVASLVFHTISRYKRVTVLYIIFVKVSICYWLSFGWTISVLNLTGCVGSVDWFHC